jgi:hypothetical protein
MNDETTRDEDLCDRMSGLIDDVYQFLGPDAFEPDRAARNAMDAVRPELDRRDAQIKGLAALISQSDADLQAYRGEYEQLDKELNQLRATLARVKELAVMGGQDPVTVRQWIVIEIDQPTTTTKEPRA